MNISVETPQTDRGVFAMKGSRRFYAGMGLTILILSIAAFLPSMLGPSTRNVPLPLTPPVAVHAALSSSWLVFFIVQAMLVRTGRIGVHRRIGCVGALLAFVLVVQGYVMCVEAARRGFDLTPTMNAEADPLRALITRLGILLEFGLLILAAIAYRRRPEIHKRLLLLATVGPLAAAPIGHLVRHWLPADAGAGIRAATLILTILLLSSSAVHDWISRGRIHPVSSGVSVLVLVWQTAIAVILPTLPAFREFAAWVVQVR